MPVSEEAIRKLDVEPRDYYFRNPGIFKNARTNPYREWYQSRRQKWKLALISGDCKTAAVVKEILKNEYEFTTSQLEDIDLISAPEGLYKQGDWILVVEDKDKPTKINWLYADRSIQVPKTDKKAFDSENSYQTFQVHPRVKSHSSFPFDERDSKFKLALRKAIKDYGANRILDLKTADPPESLLKLIMGYIENITHTNEDMTKSNSEWEEITITLSKARQETGFPIKNGSLYQFLRKTELFSPNMESRSSSKPK